MDTCRLLYNKLHSTDQWSGESIASSLTPELCANIRTCYSQLEPQVKIKLLLSTLNMPHKMVENASSELHEIFAKAENDTDEWSRVLSKMLKNFPRDGKICTHFEDENWTDAVKSISSLLIEPASANLRPLERLYMNTGSSGKIIPTQHFKFSSKHKSVGARAELLAKGRELQEQRKREQEHRDQNANLGIPQYRGQTTALPTPAARKPVSNLDYRHIFKAKEEEGIKILDMNEVPAPEPRKRRKATDRLKSQDTEEPETPSGDQDASFYDSLMRYNSFPYYGLDQPPATPRLDESYQMSSFASPSLFSPEPAYIDPETMKHIRNVLEKSNKLSEADKGLVINFMRGPRVNPAPEGSTTTEILLNSEIETKPDGKKCLVEILFEMNYETRKWRRLKRHQLIP